MNRRRQAHSTSQMKSMIEHVRGTEKVKSALGTWAASDLAYIERLELHANGDGSEVTIVGLFQRRNSGPWPNVDGPMRRVTLRFGGVKSLRLEGFGGGHTQVMGFDIRSVADRGWEDTVFEVEDYEDGRIEFMCSWAEVAEVEDTDTFLP